MVMENITPVNEMTNNDMQELIVEKEKSKCSEHIFVAVNVKC